MLGVEVFRDKQGVGQKQKDEGKEEVEEGAAENEDLENGDENGSSAAAARGLAAEAVEETAGRD